MAIDTETAHDPSKSRTAGLVLAVIVLILLGLANLPLQYVERDSDWFGQSEMEGDGTLYRYQLPPKMAGWPLNYWVQYSLDGEPQDRFWSAPRLIANLGIALGLSLFVFGYIQLRHRHLRAAGDRSRVRVMFDVGIALAILLAPGIILALQYCVAKQHQRLANQLGNLGGCRLSCWIPEPIVDHVPRHLLHCFARLREAHLINPADADLQSLARVPTLAVLHCTRGDFSAGSLEPLVSNVHFGSLELNQRTLSEADLELLARLPWTVVLSLSRTNLNAAMLPKLDPLPLRVIDLTGTPLVLSELGLPRWSRTIEEMRLTRPASGREGSLTIEGWPRLRSLSVSRLTTEPNASVFALRLKHLPNLETLRIDRLQKHDCLLHDMPRLATIDEGVSTLRFVLRFEDLIPGLMWASRLDLDGLPSLQEFGCFARDLESLSLRNLKNLRSLAIGSYYSTAYGDMQLKPVDRQRCQEWIRLLGEREGPGTVDLTALPLSGVDLAPLQNNGRIRNLLLAECGVSFDQVQRLAGMDQLESLDLSRCRLEQDALDWLLSEFPRIEDLRIDGAALTSFDMSRSDQLRAIRMTTMRDVQDVRIVDRPQLTTYLRMSCTPRHMEIRNAQSLRGLAIESPWPAGAMLGGLRDLEWFAGGGEMVDDGVLDVLLGCPKLDQLTLAYASVTREKLVEIGLLGRLSMLAVPGADVDDEVTAHWQSLKSLWEINLDDTRVSTRTIAWLSRIDSLRRLSLNRVPLDRDAADALAELGGLSELQLAGVWIAAENLRPLLENGNLEWLNLSGWKIDERLVKMLSATPSLRLLTLRDSELEAAWLEQLLAANPTLCIDIGPLRKSIGTELAGELKRRQAGMRRPGAPPWHEEMRVEADPGLVEIEPVRAWSTTPDFAGRINAQAFRPQTLTATSID